MTHSYRRRPLHRGLALIAGTTVCLGSVLIAAPIAAADVPVGGSGTVDVTVDVAAAGELSMTVANPASVVLQEAAADDGNRVFTGTLPTVTVTDTRTDIPLGEDGQPVGWSVVGQSSDFVEADDPTVVIPKENLGWAPAFVDEPAGNEGMAGVGEVVEPAAEGGAGLATGLDLLVLAYPSEDAQAVSDQWQANAGLRLAAPAADLATGSYSATITLSLFEY